MVCCLDILNLSWKLYSQKNIRKFTFEQGVDLEVNIGQKQGAANYEEASLFRAAFLRALSGRAFLGSNFPPRNRYRTVLY